jgi:hypothetical protein
MTNPLVMNQEQKPATPNPFLKTIREYEERPQNTGHSQE